MSKDLGNVHVKRRDGAASAAARSNAGEPSLLSASSRLASDRAALSRSAAMAHPAKHAPPARSAAPRCAPHHHRRYSRACASCALPRRLREDRRAADRTKPRRAASAAAASSTVGLRPFSSSTPIPGLNRWVESIFDPKNLGKIGTMPL